MISFHELEEAALYVRDAYLITADDAMLTDAMDKLDALLVAIRAEAYESAQ